MKKTNYLWLLTVTAVLTMSFVIYPNTQEEITDPGLELMIKLDEPTDTDAQGWGSWRTTDCLRGLDFRVRKDGYNKYAKKYRWSLQFRNRYRTKVNFSYQMVAPNKKYEIRRTGKTGYRTRATAGNQVSGAYFLINNANSVYVYVNKIRFGDRDAGSYANCDK